MATNTKPQLIILISNDKREALKTFAAERNVSMGNVVNQLIDKLLDGDIEVEGKSATYREPIKTASISIEQVAEMISQAVQPIEKRLTTAEEMANLQIEEISEIKKPLAALV